MRGIWTRDLANIVFRNVQLEEVFWVSVYIVHHFLIFNMDPFPSPLLAPLKKYTEINCTIFCQFLSRKNVSDPEPVKRMRILLIRIPEYWSKSKLTTFFASSVKFPPVYSVYFRRRWRTCNRGGWQSGNMCSRWPYALHGLITPPPPLLFYCLPRKHAAAYCLLPGCPRYTYTYSFWMHC